MSTVKLILSITVAVVACTVVYSTFSTIGLPSGVVFMISLLFGWAVTDLCLNI